MMKYISTKNALFLPNKYMSLVINKEECPSLFAPLSHSISIKLVCDK